MTKIIEVDHVTKRFKNKLPLNDVSFSIDAGKIYGFRGPNGSGKSVTFKTVLGFIRPNSGTVKVLGKKIRQDVIFAPDTGFAISEYGLLEDKTGLENLNLLKVLNDDQSSQAEAILQRVGLDPANPLKLKEYSLGMRQRLLIAAALLGDKQILLFDEPTNALDEDGQDFLARLLLELKDQGKTILVSSHDKDFLNRVADHIFVYSEGKIVKELEQGHEVEA
ncbi:ABC transporter ATP-binding protein [Lactobacillus delbrueckii subsp. bulgaricus]|nr:ABC transporter ATP-binding protein [Lactobacillus delbrueckii subsp. bulgaricus]MBT9012282.1 ABC transporter ATP-binding protein [Lactobacillus delbrueckii subsp. bulgaricus]MBT9064717.1 ABC transporter ATP-binding protein [Lactobacillus delbrueckii subsp. bulgaricus]